MAAKTEQSLENVHDMLTVQARKTVEAIIDARAEKFALCPSHLDIIEPGLSHRSPRKMRARIMELIDAEFSTPRRHFAFGGCIPLLNLSGAERYAQRLINISKSQVVEL